MKLTTRLIMMLVLMFAFVGMLFAGATKPKQEEITTGADVITGTVSPANTLAAQPDQIPAVDPMGPTYSQGETTTKETSELGSAHIPESVDYAVNTWLIPLIVTLLGVFKIAWDKERFRKVLSITWNLIKECDNLFDHSPPGEYATAIRLSGINAAKKSYVVSELNKALTESQIVFARKKTGSLQSLVETAISVYKYGGPAVSFLAKTVKRWTK